MTSLLLCHRGSVSFVTVIAMLPLAGALALGAEAGSWYVTRQSAQNSADAAAYSGALKLACSLSASCADTSSVDYRGKQYAAQNYFCNTGDTSYPGSRCGTLPSNISRSVQIASLTSWNGAGGNFVQAIVGQQQPAYLASLLGLTTVNINATAVAKVFTLSNPCILSLVDPIAFQGSTTVQAPACGLASNSTASNSVDFTGNGLDVSNAGTISGQGGCYDTGGTQCNSAVTYAPLVPDPLSGLNSAMSSLTTANFSGSCPSGNFDLPTAYDTTAGQTCVNAGFTFKSNGAPTKDGKYPLNGVYFFSGSLTIQSAEITGTATWILLPGATLTINGNPTIQLTALDTVSTTQVPAALTSVVGLMSKLLIYDPETTASNQSVTISGNSTSYFNGIVYAPNASVVYQGSTASYTCVQVIAKGVTLSGNSNLDNSGCPASSKIESHIVRLVQ